MESGTKLFEPVTQSYITASLHTADVQWRQGLCRMRKVRSQAGVLCLMCQNAWNPGGEKKEKEKRLMAPIVRLAHNVSHLTVNTLWGLRATCLTSDRHNSCTAAWPSASRYTRTHSAVVVKQTADTHSSLSHSYTSAIGFTVMNWSTFSSGSFKICLSTYTQCKTMRSPEMISFNLRRFFHKNEISGSDLPHIFTHLLNK